MRPFYVRVMLKIKQKNAGFYRLQFQLHKSKAILHSGAQAGFVKQIIPFHVYYEQGSGNGAQVALEALPLPLDNFL